MLVVIPYTVCREGLWKIMAKFGCPAKFILIVRQFHDGMKARVQDGGEYSEPFLVTNGVKQGCILAPTLFSMVFSAMLSDAFRDGDIAVSFRYRTDSSLFSLRRLQAKTKVREDTARDFLFADDCALNASKESDMQESMDLFAKACDDFGLTISTKKTEVMHQPAPAAPYTEPNITVDGQRLAVVDKFVYLGSTLSRSITHCQSQRCLRQTERPGLGAPVPEARNQTESLQGSYYSIPALCKRDMDCLQPACQTTQILPHEMSEDPASHQVAGQSSRH